LFDVFVLFLNLRVTNKLIIYLASGMTLIKSIEKFYFMIIWKYFY